MKVAALLRAVNVGGRQVKMAELREALAGAFGECRTLLASGNVVLDVESVAGLEDQLDALFQARFGFVSEFVVRDAAGLDAVIAANPFPDAAGERPAKLLVTFHREPPDPALAERLAAEHAGSERVALVGRELFIDFPNGVGVSTIDRTMKRLKWPKIATARNWNTVLKLRAMLD